MAKERKHPTIKILRQWEKEQQSIREDLIKNSTQDGQTVNAICKELVLKASKEATDFFNFKTSSNQGTIKLSKINKNYVYGAGCIAMGIIKKEFPSMVGQSECMMLFDDEQEMFYLRKSTATSKVNAHKIKIGKTTTTARKGRESSYKTSSGGDNELVYCVNACSDLNEKNVLSWLNSLNLKPILGREWFIVDDKTAATLKSPAILREAIKKQNNE
jgi:hypothetical protein